MKRIMPFAAAFLMLLAAVVGMLLVKSVHKESDTAYDGAQFVLDTPECTDGESIYAIRFINGGEPV